MPNNSYIISPWYPTQNYAQYQVTQGIYTGFILAPSYSPSLYFSTIANNSGNHPSGVFVYSIASYNRLSDVATINVTYTGTNQSFNRGSLVTITGLLDPTFNYSGMVINGGASYFQYSNVGQDVNYSTSTEGAVNFPQPAWTSGFFWSPAYSTSFDIKQAVVSAQFEAGYQQRQAQGINSNTTTWSIVFQDRSDIEVKGILAFVQNMGGIYSCPILVPPTQLYNNPNLKYVLSNPKVVSKSYGLSDVTVSAVEVFEY